MDKWGDITNEQLRLWAAKQGADSQPRYRPVSVMTEAQKRAAIAKLSELARSTDRDPKAWAYKLRDKERRGERLSAIQRSAWREVLHEHD